MHKKLKKPLHGTTNLHKRSETWVWGLSDAFPLCGDTHPFMWLNYGFMSDTKTNPVLMVDAANNCILLASEIGIPSLCSRCIVVDLSCNCEACSLDAPGVVTPDTAPDISEPN